VFYIYIQIRIPRLIILSIGTHSFKTGTARTLGLIAPQAAIGRVMVGFVGNPSLCPAFRVRRGSGREYGSMTSRARRATRPTPSEFRCHVGMAPTSAAGERAGASLAARFALRSPAAAVHLGNTLGVGRVANGTDGHDRGAQGTTESSGRRARPYDQPLPSAQLHPAVPASAGRATVGGRAQAAPT
jgi:hypothetical protein